MVKLIVSQWMIPEKKGLVDGFNNLLVRFTLGCWLGMDRLLGVAGGCWDD
jgi:hypothetical protein